MAKEQVIIFEGEHLFVSPKNHIVDNKTGMVYNMASEVNLVEPKDEVVMDKPVKPLMQPDEPTPTPTTSEPILSRGGNAPLGGAGNPLPSLGDPTKIATPQEEATPAPAPEPQKATIPILPISFGSAPVGGGGGGGGSKKEEATPKKTLLQKYWWLIVLAGVGGYILYKRKK
jgi:hypothetical protein